MLPLAPPRPPTLGDTAEALDVLGRCSKFTTTLACENFLSCCALTREIFFCQARKR
jgi:hypothetical protein